ncbi:MAG: TolC family protein, partial [Bdellovibrionales bacterium]|nr:TolC family protein [Bdellovibrionales bacterium]
ALRSAKINIERTLRSAYRESLVPIHSGLRMLPGHNFDKEYQDFLRESRTQAILKLLLSRSKLQVERDADDLLPSIDLVAGYRATGENYALENGDNTLLFGIHFEWPFEDQVESAEYAISKIGLDKQRLSNTNTTYRLRADLHSLHSQILREKELLAIADEKIELAKSVLNAEAENYSFGKVTLNDYIDAVNEHDSSRFNRITRLARLESLVVEWLRLTDRLVTKTP